MKSKEFLVSYSNKDIIDRLEKIEVKLDNALERGHTNRKLIYAGFGFTMAVLGIVVGHLI